MEKVEKYEKLNNSRLWSMTYKELFDSAILEDVLNSHNSIIHIESSDVG